MSPDEHRHDHHAPTATAGHGRAHDHDAPVDDGLNPSATHGHDHAAAAAEGGHENGHASPAPKVKQKGHGHSHGHGVIDSSIVRSRAGPATMPGLNIGYARVHHLVAPLAGVDLTACRTLFDNVFGPGPTGQATSFTQREVKLNLGGVCARSC